MAASIVACVVLLSLVTAARFPAFTLDVDAVGPRNGGVSGSDGGAACDPTDGEGE